MPSEYTMLVESRPCMAQQPRTTNILPLRLSLTDCRTSTSLENTSNHSSCRKNCRSSLVLLYIGIPPEASAMMMLVTFATPHWRHRFPVADSLSYSSYGVIGFAHSLSYLHRHLGCDSHRTHCANHSVYDAGIGAMTSHQRYAVRSALC